MCRVRAVLTVAVIAALAFAAVPADAQTTAAGESGSMRPWHGPYFGIAGGHATAKLATRDGGTAISNPPYGAFACGPALTGNYCDTPFLLEAEGGVGSLLAGMSWQWGRILAGIEIDASALDVGTMKTLYRPFNDRDFLSVRYDWAASGTGRLGYAIGDSLFYAKAGVALVHARTIAADIDLTGVNFGIYPGSLASGSRVSTGWTFGGGIEHALGQAISLRAEYMLTMLERERTRSPEGDIYRHHHELGLFRLGLVYRLPAGSFPGW